MHLKVLTTLFQKMVWFIRDYLKGRKDCERKECGRKKNAELKNVNIGQIRIL